MHAGGKRYHVGGKPQLRREARKDTHRVVRGVECAPTHRSVDWGIALAELYYDDPRKLCRSDNRVVAVVAADSVNLLSYDAGFVLSAQPGQAIFAAGMWCDSVTLTDKLR